MSQEAAHWPRGTGSRALPPFWKKAGGKLFVAVSHRQEKDFRFFLSEGEGCYGRQAGSFLLASIVAKGKRFGSFLPEERLLRVAGQFISSGFNRCQEKFFGSFFSEERLLRVAGQFLFLAPGRCHVKVLCFFLSRKKREPDRAKRRKGRPKGRSFFFLSFFPGLTRCAGPPRGPFWRRCGRG